MVKHEYKKGEIPWNKGLFQVGVKNGFI